MDLSDSVDYEQLDPGVRKMVRWLRENGFETTDSGDGETKSDEARAFGDIPHVCIKTTRKDLLTEADRLWNILGYNLPLVMNRGEVHVEATYDPADRSAIILLLRLHDRMLPW